MVLLSACGTVADRERAPAVGSDFSSIPDAVPRVEPRSPHGNPRSYVVNGKQYFTLASARGFTQRGIASWYGPKFHGRRTSSGETYDMYKMTAAHKTLPLPTYLSVQNLSTGREIVVRVNDRGPFHGERILDLSYAAASKLGIARKGTGLVEVKALVPGSGASPAADPARVEPLRPPPGPVRLFIQAGAFRTSDNAAKLRAGLAAAVSAVPVLVRRATTTAGRVMYRVWLGPLPSVEDAVAALAGTRRSRNRKPEDRRRVVVSSAESSSRVDHCR